MLLSNNEWNNKKTGTLGKIKNICSENWFKLFIRLRIFRFLLRVVKKNLRTHSQNPNGAVLEILLINLKKLEQLQEDLICDTYWVCVYRRTLAHFKCQALEHLKFCHDVYSNEVLNVKQWQSEKIMSNSRTFRVLRDYTKVSFHEISTVQKVM